MYSSLQQQCLVELGITPYDLNDNYKARLRQSESQAAQSVKEVTESTANTKNGLGSSITVPSITNPSITEASINPSFTNTATGEGSVKANTEVSQAETHVENYWLTSPESFIKDIKLIFPNIKFELLFGNANVGVLQDVEGKKVVWALNPNILAVQSEVIENITVITSPVPSSLTAMDKKHLWALIKPYSSQSD